MTSHNKSRCNVTLVYVRPIIILCDAKQIDNYYFYRYFNWRIMLNCRGVYFSVWPPPTLPSPRGRGGGLKYGQITGWGKKDWKGIKKGWKFFACGAHPLIMINFCWGKNINQEWIWISNLIYTPAELCYCIKFSCVLNLLIKCHIYIMIDLSWRNKNYIYYFP